MYKKRTAHEVVFDFLPTLAVLFLLAWLIMSQVGCTYTRNAPLFETNIEANGNTVPVSAAP